MFIVKIIFNAHIQCGSKKHIKIFKADWLLHVQARSTLKVCIFSTWCIHIFHVNFTTNRHDFSNLQSRMPFKN